MGHGKFFLSINQIKPGDYLKISGKYRPGQGFLAVEVEYESGSEWVLESLVQALDADGSRLRLCDRWWSVPWDCPLKDETGVAANLSEVRPGQLIKLKGNGVPDGSFKIAKVRLKETMEFNVEMLKGHVQEVIPQQGQLRLLGIPVVLDARTVILKDRTSDSLQTERI